MAAKNVIENNIARTLTPTIFGVVTGWLVTLNDDLKDRKITQAEFELQWSNLIHGIKLWNTATIKEMVELVRKNFPKLEAALKARTILNARQLGLTPAQAAFFSNSVNIPDFVHNIFIHIGDAFTAKRRTGDQINAVVSEAIEVAADAIIDVDIVLEMLYGNKQSEDDIVARPPILETPSVSARWTRTEQVLTTPSVSRAAPVAIMPAKSSKSQKTKAAEELPPPSLGESDDDGAAISDIDDDDDDDDDGDADDAEEVDVEEDDDDDQAVRPVPTPTPAQLGPATPIAKAPKTPAIQTPAAIKTPSVATLSTPTVVASPLQQSVLARMPPVPSTPRAASTLSVAATTPSTPAPAPTDPTVLKEWISNSGRGVIEKAATNVTSVTLREKLAQRLNAA